MTNLGAPAALHGYRVQALYTLSRILMQADNNYVFHPEGLEDLDIYSNNGKLLELIQVKKYAPLQLSDLDPGQRNAFFRRVLQNQQNGQSFRVQLVNFGAFGPELQNAWQGQKRERTRVEEKLREYGYTNIEIQALFSSIELLEIDEESEESGVHKLLRQLHEGVDPQNAFDLLHHWMFTAMEKQKRIAYSDVVEKLNSVGRWLVERQNYYTQFHTTIQSIEASPNVLERQDSLQREFYEGGFTTYDHIASNLDFPRNRRLTEIEDGFATTNIVVVHAASGQGKTTLALRYLQDRYPKGWRFFITRVENVQHALAAANALSGFAKALEAPVAVYLDVKPSDTDWIEFARQLSQHPYLRILITIREEDYRRTLASADFIHSPLDLDFDESEARILYERAQAVTLHRQFLNFDAAWDAFGGDGPLLEFVYLITQTKTLRQRLQGQVARILNEVREKQLEPDEVRLLRLVAVATACDARISTRKLVSALNLPEPSTTLKFFEKEYLIRVTDSGFIEGLHAIRSRILADLLTDLNINRWLDLAEQVLSLLLEEDWEPFILNAAINHPNDFPQLLALIRELEPSTWRGTAGVLRGSLWADIKSSVLRSKVAIDAAKEEFGPGWYFIPLLNSVSDDTPNIDRWWQSEKFSSLFSPERIQQLNAIRDMQPSNVEIFNPTKLWLEKISIPLQPPIHLQDWTGIAFVLYWASVLDVTHLQLPAIEPTLPIFVLADILYAVSKYAPRQNSGWLTDHASQLNSRLANELNILYLQSKDNRLTVHFLVSESEIAQRGESEPLHAATIQRLQLIRQLYPNYEEYGSQGYGHKLGNALQLDFDDTHKPGVNRKNLVPSLATWANEVAVGIASFELRIENWNLYVEKVIETRRLVVACFKQLHNGLYEYIKNRTPVKVNADLNKDDWTQCLALLNNRPDLPKSAVDPWGFVSESQKEYGNKPLVIEQTGAQKNFAPVGIALQIYKPYLKAQRDYYSQLLNFMQQSPDVMEVNFNLSKLPPGPVQKTRENELRERGIRTDRAHLSTHNFWDVKRHLLVFQKEFRTLFLHIADSSLQEIETEEQLIVSQIWLLWHHYAHKPTHTLSDPLHNIAHNAENEKRIVDRWIRRSLSKFSNNQHSAKQLYIDLLWSEAPVLTIQLDVNEATKLYEAFNTCIEALHSQFHSLHYHDLKHYLIREYYERIVIVPTIRGRLVNKNAWVLYTLSTILNSKPFEQHNWVSYLMHPLSTEWLDALNLPKWQLSQIQQANEISGAVFELMILASQIAELSILTEVNDESADMLQVDLQQRSKSMSKLLQKYLDNSTIVIDVWNQLLDREKPQRKYLSNAIDLLMQLHPFILPSASNTTQHLLQLDDVVAYAQRLSQVFSHVESLRLLLIADAVESPAGQI